MKKLKNRHTAPTDNPAGADKSAQPDKTDNPDKLAETADRPMAAGKPNWRLSKLSVSAMIAGALLIAAALAYVRTLPDGNSAATVPGTAVIEKLAGDSANTDGFEYAPDVADPVLLEVQKKINSSFKSFGVAKNVTGDGAMKYRELPDNYNIIVPISDELGILGIPGNEASIETNLDVKQLAVQVLTARGFKPASVTVLGSENTFLALGTQVCEIDINDNTLPGYIGCSTTSVIHTQAAATRLFYQALQRDNPELSKTIVSYFFHNIEPSKTPGYRLATVGMGDEVGSGAGLFYEKNGVWHFFTITQSALGCEQMKQNSDVRAAYKGFECIKADNTLGTLD